jgi:hypothetical protein
VSICFCFRFCKELRHFNAKKLVKKVDFLCDSEALKVFRKYRCHPVQNGAKVCSRSLPPTMLLFFLKSRAADLDPKDP